MTLKNLFMLNAVLATAFGIVFVLVPAQTLALYGVTLSDPGLFVARLLGATFIEVGLLAWFARTFTATDALKAMVLAFLVGNTIAFIASLLAQLAGVANGLGWSTVVIYLVLALGYGYFQFMKPAG